MKNLIITALMTLCSTLTMAQNPLIHPFNTAYQVPAFSKIKLSDYLPAFQKAIEIQRAEIAAIVANTDQPTFENTILALDNSGEMFERISLIFSGISGSDMTEDLKAIQAEILPMITAHRGDISLNSELFERVKSVCNNSEQLGKLEARLSEKTYKSFARNGANLTTDQKARLREIDGELSLSTMIFGNNLTADNGAFVLNLTKKGDLKGLPQSIIDRAANEAKQRNLTGWAFTLDKPSLIPFLENSERRDLRQKLYEGYLERCNHNNLQHHNTMNSQGKSTDNKPLITKIANLRLERATLLGYDSHSHFTLDMVMAKTPANVMSLLEELWTPALKLATMEMVEMQKLPGAPADFQSWDWWYWAEKLRQTKYDLNQEELRPYFALDNVRDGIFALTKSLYGLNFKQLTDIEKYNFANQVFEVTDSLGAYLGVLYLDFHPRAGKRVGAWCTRFGSQSYKDGRRVAPIVSIVCNFTPSTGDHQPALLNMDEVETFFHEFGHGIHSLVSEVKYKGLAGVERDFVELPSQIMEHWATEPQILRTYARHHKTGQIIPDALIEKIRRSALFNQGFATTEFLAAALLDMSYHTITAPMSDDVIAHETSYLRSLGLPQQIAPRYRSTYFQHIFNGGYSSGYYSYIWAEVLDADAFETFVETGDIVNREVAQRFLNEILKQGGSADGNTLYLNFRTKAPSKEPLMRNRGLVTDQK